ncbi:hypothetical protein J6590_071689 [Homalodisca vitripennis]|nr:hypothetical protein J6590_071689 [Homalodisca vitripennis]
MEKSIRRRRLVHSRSRTSAKRMSLRLRLRGDGPQADVLSRFPANFNNAIRKKKKNFTAVIQGEVSDDREVEALFMKPSNGSKTFQPDEDDVVWVIKF